ncbi:class I SAM-dependent methyltransferase [Longirhabdus pacifica]|uniref:class I SAM-dependent methyltransferase n=1 Tax=Longirhabdus pacifica TaxID=2305227 RepID=UPI0010091EB0|nr:class I SAM-dependent methyltransferase [Longirhabdus pacifica]
MKNALGSHLFDSTYFIAYEAVGQYTAHTIWHMLQDAGLSNEKFQHGLSLSEILQHLQCHHRYEHHVAWALYFLKAKQYLTWNEDQWMTLPSPLPFFDKKTISETVPSHFNIQPSIDLIDYVAKHWISIIQNNVKAEHILFHHEGLSLWEHYFSNDHHLYAVHNYGTAEYVFSNLHETATPIHMLELGVGFGSATSAMLQSAITYAKPIDQYTITDVSPALANKVKKHFALQYPSVSFTSRKFDIEHSTPKWSHTFDYIYAVNVMHCAEQIVDTLANMQALLKEDGMLVLSECVRQDHQVQLHQEFIFSLLPHFRLLPKQQDTIDHTIPCYGFWSGEDWKYFMEQAGYIDIHVHVNAGSSVCGAIISGKKKV